MQGTGVQATSPLVREIDEAASFLRAKGVGRPEWGIVLGTGLGSLAGALGFRSRCRIATSRTFRSRPSSRTPASGCSASSQVVRVVMRGRAHYYEGYTMKQVTFPVRVLRALGRSRRSCSRVLRAGSARRTRSAGCVRSPTT